MYSKPDLCYLMNTLQNEHIGHEVDGYRILDVLGQGGMGIVYKVHNLSLDRIEALKVITPHLIDNEDFLHRFRQEAQALAKIHHPNIVTVYAQRESELGHYITMEYVEGQDLSEVLRDYGAVSWEDMMPLLKQLLSAFERAHSRGILHRDIKPHNIMLTPGRQVKVMDFGLAKFYQQQGMTMTQGVAGTPFYMSPEQIKGLRLDQRSDLFSLGMTVYELLSGQLPFDKQSSLFQIQRAIVEESFPNLCDLKDTIPQRLSEILMKALAQDRDERYSFAREMLADLEAFERAVGEPDTLTGDAPILGGKSGYKTGIHEETVTTWSRISAVSQVISDRPAAKWMLSVAGAVALVFTLWGMLASGDPKPVLTPLAITSAPADATVWINDERVGTTPYEVNHATGTYTIRVEKAGFVSQVQDVSLEAGQPYPLHLALPPTDTEGREPTLASLAISSTPADATVWIDGEPVGTTPYAITQQPGTYHVRVQKDGFEAQTQQVSLEAGQSHPLRFTLQALITDSGPPPTNDPPPVRRLGTLKVNTMPLGGEVFLDGQSIGSAGSAEKAPGTYTLRCGTPPYAVEQTIEVQAGASQAYTCYFEHILQVKVLDENGNSTEATVLVDGTDAGRATGQGARLSRRPGDYTIRIHRDGFEQDGAAQTVSVRPAFEQRTHTLTFRLRPSAPTVRPVERAMKLAHQDTEKLKAAMLANDCASLSHNVLNAFCRKIVEAKSLRKHDIKTVEIYMIDDEMQHDASQVVLPVTLYFETQQKGQDYVVPYPKRPSVWTWRVQGDALTLVDIK